MAFENLIEFQMNKKIWIEMEKNGKSFSLFCFFNKIKTFSVCDCGGQFVSLKVLFSKLHLGDFCENELIY